MKHYNYAVNAPVCVQSIEFDLDDQNRIHNLVFHGGCPGNHLGIAALVEGCDADAVKARLRGIRCGDRPSSCPNELAACLEKTME